MMAKSVTIPVDKWCDRVDSAGGQLDGDGGGASVQDVAYAVRYQSEAREGWHRSRWRIIWIRRRRMQYLEFTHEQYKKHVGDEFGKTIMGFRGDEPDYSIRGLPWTPKFFDAFQQVKGYDVRPYLAAFLLPRGPAR